MMQEKAFTKKRFIPFLLLSILILIIYGNSFNAGWHMDDYPNIVWNKMIHMKDLKPGSIVNTFFADPVSPGNKLFRPVACLSFGINWLIGKDNVFGYHLVNIIVHILTSFFLYLAVFTLLDTPKLKNQYSEKNRYFIAFLTASLWAANPIQTQAVTYLVQRMASLAALFTIIGIWFYIKARTAQSLADNGWKYFIPCGACCLLAVLSKENAVVMPFSLLLIEMVFFRQKADITINTLAFAGLGLIVFSSFAMIFLKGRPMSFLNGYYVRSFDLFQRLITEPRVILLYISQIFYPVPERLSLVHDLAASKTLFVPWTTIPAIILVSSIILIGFLLAKKKPLAGFAILFFFLNHLVESTILPLELVFEHRNYLPSLFIFMPVAAELKTLLDHYMKKQVVLGSMIFVFIVGVLIMWGMGTHTRNMAWANSKTLNMDILAKAPKSNRPYQGLAKYYADHGHFKRAISLYKISLHLEAQRPGQSKGLSLNNIGNIYLRLKKYPQAISFYKKSLAVHPDVEITTYNLCLAYIKDGQWDNADESINRLLQIDSTYENYLNVKGLILMKHKNYAKANLFLSKAYRLSPHDRNILINLGADLMLLGRYKNAAVFLRKAVKVSPNDCTAFIYYLANFLESGNFDGAGKILKKMLSIFIVYQIRENLHSLAKDNTAAPLPINKLALFIGKEIKATSF